MSWGWRGEDNDLDDFPEVMALESVFEPNLGLQGILNKNKEPREGAQAWMYFSCSEETFNLPLLRYKLDAGGTV